ncbi:MAG: dockerin type I domain-containing protein [Patescibacteria group bacterium]
MYSKLAQLEHFVLISFFVLSLFVIAPQSASATNNNILTYSDTLSDSTPGDPANHTIGFTTNIAVSPGARIDITPPTGFTILATSTFSDVRNVEMVVNGTPRLSSSSPDATFDGVTITTGSPGLIEYTLNSSTGLSQGDQVQILIGNHTSKSNVFSINFSSSTGTTTTAADIEPIENGPSLGRNDMTLEIYDGGLVANANPVLYLIEEVNVPSLDTTETVPPFRFNGAPTTTVGGTTLNVEISLETDELAVCQFSASSGVAYGSSAANVFDTTGLIFHSEVVAIVPNSVNTFYVRCIDDEGNFNTDDYVIQFTVNDIPTGTANEEGDVSGDGSGSGNEGTGDGSGSGGTTGNSSGETPAEGGDAGTGGSGGGGGGSSGDDDDDESGGGFESTDAPFESGDGRVIINGYAFPFSTIVALVDGNIAETDTSDSDGRYSVTIDEIARGVYTFGVYGVDDENVRSSTFSTSFTVTGSRTSSLSNVNVMPSILVEPDPAEIGDLVVISGYTLPDATVTIENEQDGSSASLETLVTESDNRGRWSVEVDTTGFARGTYKVRARANGTDVNDDPIETDFSGYTFYGVGQEAEIALDADLNRDGSVNLIDFSILLFWWGTDGGASDPPADINRDGNVTLTDFSILLFNWTG